MDSIHVCGGTPLGGEVRIQGSKNAVLPIMAAAVLVPGRTVLQNCPDIADVRSMIQLLRSIGCKVEWSNGTLRIDADRISGNVLPTEYVRKMRSSVILMGALLGRVGEVHLDYPGGCVIGKRPIDLHLQALGRMGVEFWERGGRLEARASDLRSSKVALPFASVGATENVILAAALAKGDTVVYGAAREPEIRALCDFLIHAGARIESMEGKALVIRGVEALHPCQFTIPFDRIVAGTYLFGCMAAGGRICVRDADPGQMASVLDVLEQMGGKVRCSDTQICLEAAKRPLAIPKLKTSVYPGFPTDLQSPLMAALCLARGESVIEETIFEDRLRIVSELRRMGADITAQGCVARIKGVEKLYGTHVYAEELRGGAALVMAGLAAEGETVVEGRKYIDRGYEDIERDILSLGGRL